MTVFIKERDMATMFVKLRKEIFPGNKLSGPSLWLP